MTTPTARQIDAAIFDLGGVLMRNGSPRDLVARYPDQDPDFMIELIMGPPGQDSDHQWHRLERGEITLEEARTTSSARLKELGIVATAPPSQPTPPTSTARDGQLFRFNANEAMMQLVADLRAAGLRTGMLTNNVREFRSYWWDLTDWSELFDDIVDSHEVGMRKPNPAIYRLATERLGVDPARTSFADDLAPNAQAATDFGMHGVHVVGEGAEAIATIRRLAGLG